MNSDECDVVFDCVLAPVVVLSWCVVGVDHYVKVAEEESGGRSRGADVMYSPPGSTLMEP